MPTAVRKIPIWLIEEEVGGGMPGVRRYHWSHIGSPIGHIVLPPGCEVNRYAEYVSIHRRVAGGTPELEHVACLGSTRLVAAAVSGEFELRWESATIAGGGSSLRPTADPTPATPPPNPPATPRGTP